ncbi:MULTISPECIES: hypothetical protein [unclassified Microbacterium]|uniref:hypothetical protein n=1 Tax=unclassified Microbacterium TaxID=2609290 RepID=UPI00214B116C|nr:MULTISPECIES: hypothetical protein [unclassified Microbacterium]MCR2785435.1 hypothetical protein [Microbacterium sp. zg.B96]WIM14538.1 hypothetical protein QNO11_08085 [Microbacterium sp. zg-B96]
MTVRKELEALLQEDWAEIPELADFRVIATERGLDVIEQPTVLIRMTSIQREPSAPQVSRRVELVLTLISPLLDLDEAGDQLEEVTLAALDYLGPRFIHGTASVVGYNANLAVDIPLTIIAGSPVTAPEEE